jgi:hypothetical protein
MSLKRRFASCNIAGDVKFNCPIILFLEVSDKLSDDCLPFKAQFLLYIPTVLTF